MKIVLRVLLVVLIIVAIAGLTFYFNPLWVGDQITSFQLWRAGVKSEYVEAGGYRLHYFEAKPTHGDGAPLLLIHGLGARGEDWRAMIPAMAARGFHVYVPDLPGYGRSSKPKDADYSISMEERAVVAFAQAIHLPHAFVGGWSMGGWVAMKMTLDHPEMVNRLVVYDSAGIYFPADFGSELFVPTNAPAIARLMKMLSPHPKPIPEFVERAVLRKIAHNSWVVVRSVSAMANGRDLLDFRLENIHQPTLVVWGSADELIPLEVGKRIHESIPNSSLSLIKGCGHLAPLECWQPVAEATDEFLRAQPPMQRVEKTFFTSGN
ncbi:alpha/beta fold hydrolase [Edaphobacter albus]|uniref:alpha/beta fold hydrolase n=1 Tax=Edaphobacter sp. 4G125 TaxID=2763071 RepID=UPI00164847D6|nr:alpha/beta hydrolase [Edaphobacter sp. 4G125]QNI38113.1 alpha/beta hydrolase [Edaphobacter sp. 4G125]